MNKDENNNFDNDLIHSPGEMIRQSRLAKNLSISDISKKTRISKAMVEALENGEQTLLPGRTYETGYIRLICEITGDNPQPIINKWIEEFYSGKKPNPYSFPEAKIKSETSYIGFVGIIIASIIIFSYAGWYFYTLQNSEDSFYEENDILDGPIEGELTNGINENEIINDNSSLVLPKDNQGNKNSKLLINGDTNLDKDVKKSALQNNLDNSSISNFDQSLNNDSEKNKVSEGNMQKTITSIESIEGVKDSWVQITYADGRLLFSGMLKKGQIQQIPNDELLFSFGNAGSVGLKLNDSDLKIIGYIGEIIQSLSTIELISRIKNSQDSQ